MIKRPITARERRAFARQVKDVSKIVMVMPPKYQLKRGRNARTQKVRSGYNVFLTYPLDKLEVISEAAHVASEKALTSALPKFRMHKGRKERLIRNVGGISEAFDMFNLYRIVLANGKRTGILKLKRMLKEINDMVAESSTYAPKSVKSGNAIFGSAIVYGAIRSGFDTPDKIEKLMLILSRKDFAHIVKNEKRLIASIPKEVLTACKKDKGWKTMKKEFFVNIILRAPEFAAMNYIGILGGMAKANPAYLDELVRRAKSAGVITLVK